MVNTSRKTVSRPRLRMFFILLMALILLLPALGFAYASVMSAREANDFSPPGKLVDIEGYWMHIHCIGGGSPTIVMDAGLGGWSADWSLVQPLTAGVSRVCTYDRAGMGWSDGRPTVRDAQASVRELHLLLANIDETGPYILVGHSNGAIRMLLYAHTYPEEVNGVILVDPTPLATSDQQMAYLSVEEQAAYITLTANLSADAGSEGLTFFSWMETLCPFGVTRLLSNTLLEMTVYPYLPSSVQPGYRAMINRCSYFATFRGESLELPRSLEQVCAVNTLEDMPLVVLASSSLRLFYRDSDLPEVSGELGILLDKMLRQSQREIAELSSQGIFVQVTESGHYLMLDRPDAVIEAIRNMIAE
jgi:pimeloyl-ACP methyl ester carboxylesterase